MSKIVCDVCGTSYADSATQCPICGCARPGDSILFSSENQESDVAMTEGYTYVKGGRFSRSNVKKRRNNTLPDNEEPTQPPKSRSKEPENKSDKGLIVAVCMLLLAIVAVAIYIVVHFFGPQSNPNQKPDDGIANQSTTAATDASTDEDKSCTAIVLSQSVFELKVGQNEQLVAIVTPEDTTDTITYSSLDDTIATVSEEGIVQAVSVGETKITVMCGQIMAECTIICIPVNENVEPTDIVDPTETVDPTEVIEPTQATESNQPTETTEATQSTQPTEPSDSTESTQPTESTPATEPTQNTDGYTAPYKLNRHISGQPTERDVSIAIDESFQLKLLDANDKVVPVEWKADRKSVCTISGNTIKGKTAGTTKITATYEGVTYTCLVRVKSAS